MAGGCWAIKALLLLSSRPLSWVGEEKGAKIGENCFMVGRVRFLRAEDRKGGVAINT